MGLRKIVGELARGVEQKVDHGNEPQTRQAEVVSEQAHLQSTATSRTDEENGIIHEHRGFNRGLYVAYFLFFFGALIIISAQLSVVAPLNIKVAHMNSQQYVASMIVGLTLMLMRLQDITTGGLRKSKYNDLKVDLAATNKAVTATNRAVEEIRTTMDQLVGTVHTIEDLNRAAASNRVIVASVASADPTPLEGQSLAQASELRGRLGVKRRWRNFLVKW